MQDANGDGAIKVVVADDDEDIRRLVRTNLEIDGRFEVVGECRDGVETISVIRNVEPDVAIVDLDMPKLSGLEAVRRIRTLRPDVTVVVYSASGRDGSATVALEAGAHGFIDKRLEITNVAPKVVAAFCATSGGGDSVPPRRSPAQ